MTRVAAAVIERNGKILIGQRPAGKPHPLEWEFPGGKVEPGETPETALARELKEELQIKAKIGRELKRYMFAYEGKPPIELIFLEVNGFAGEPMNQAFADIRWVTRDEMSKHPFLAGDEEFLKFLLGRD